jgi:hypothetical protein
MTFKITSLKVCSKSYPSEQSSIIALQHSRCTLYSRTCLLVMKKLSFFLFYDVKSLRDKIITL